MIAALVQVAEDIVYGRAVVSLALALVALQIVVLVMAVRRRRRGAVLPLKLHAIAGAAIAAQPVVAGLSVDAARALILEVVNGASLGRERQGDGAVPRHVRADERDPVHGHRHRAGAGGLLIGSTYTLSAPRADGRARGYSPAMLVGVGLLPIAAGRVAVEHASDQVVRVGGRHRAPGQDGGHPWARSTTAAPS